MNKDAEKCVEKLSEIIDVNDDGEAVFSATTHSRREYIMPILLEELGITPDGLRISERKIESEIINLIAEIHQEDDPVSEFEKQTHKIRERIEETDTEKFTIAFPLNFRNSQRELLPEPLQIDETTFEPIDLEDWKSEWVPDYQNPNDDRKLGNLSDFLEKTPNQVDDPEYTFWKADCHARDTDYAVDQVVTALGTVIAQLNYAIHYHRTEVFSMTSGPWPDRWAELRSPFIYFAYDADGYRTHYFPEQDAAYRKPDGPRTTDEEQFKEVVEALPDFQEDEYLDTRIRRAFDMFQSGITNPETRNSFFEFWRGIEIISSIDRGDSIDKIVDRVSKPFVWKNPEIAELRLKRITKKRNTYVHEGDHVSIERVDRNLVKILLEKVLKLACEKRFDWNVREWQYVLENFEKDEERLDRNIELLEEMRDNVDS